jgi:hypothetical protein
MNDFLQASQLRDEARRLLRYRVPLTLAVLCNLVLLIRFPFARSQTNAAPPPPPAAAQVASDLLPPNPPPAVAPADRPALPAAAAVPTAPDVSPPQAVNIGTADIADASRRLAHATQRGLVQVATSPWAQTLRASFAHWSAERQRERAAPAPVPPPRQALTLRNLRDNGGPVRLLVNGRICELGPGEAHEFTNEPAWVVQFHRGEDFGDEQRTLTGGSYDFIVTDQGWALQTRP